MSLEWDEVLDRLLRFFESSFPATIMRVHVVRDLRGKVRVAFRKHDGAAPVDPVALTDALVNELGAWFAGPALSVDAAEPEVRRLAITLFWSAAHHALKETPGASYRHLLTPEEMKAGLRETSQRRVAELVEEHPVVQRLKNLADIPLPWQIEEAAALLAVPFQDEADGFDESGDQVLEELVRLGVVSLVTRGKRIDIPDIYRLHFRIDRVGQKVAVGPS